MAGQLIDFCEMKIVQERSEKETLLWQFLKVHNSCYTIPCSCIYIYIDCRVEKKYKSHFLTTWHTSSFAVKLRVTGAC